MGKIKIRKLDKNVQRVAENLCNEMLDSLEKAQRPILQATKCSLDNSIYRPSKGYLVPGDKKVTTELNVSSVQKLSRTVFLLDIMLNNLKVGTVNSTRELYYMSKGLTKSDPKLKALAFSEQSESDSIINYITHLLEIYREEINCHAGDSGGKTFSKNLVVTETESDGTVSTVDLGAIGTVPFQPQNKPQQFKLKPKKGKIDFCLIVESESTVNTLVTNGFTKRNNCIIIGSKGVPSNGVRGWCKTIQDQLDVPMYFYGDLDAYTIQNIYRTLKAGSAASLIRNSDFSAPDVRFLGVLPSDVKKYDLESYDVSEKNASDARSIKKAKDALQNDPFFRDKKNKKISDVLRWLITQKVRCEQQALFAVNPKDPHTFEKIILDKIKRKDFI